MIRYGWELFEEEMAWLLTVAVSADVVLEKSSGVDMQLTPTVSGYMQITPTESRDMQITPTGDTWE